MSRTFDVVVVGNGAIGMTLARALGTAGGAARVALVGPRSRQGSASPAAGAMINVWGEVEDGCLDDPPLAARFALGRRALDLWADHAGALEDESGLPVRVRWGTWVLSGPRGPAREERSFEYLADLLRRAGEPTGPIAARDLEFLAPDPGTRAMRALRIPDGFVDSRSVMGALETALRRLPACHAVDGTVERLTVEGSGEKVLRLADGGDLRTRTVVLANGAFAQRLIDPIPELKSSVPRLLFGGGSALDVSFPTAGAVPPALHGLDCVVRTLDRGGGCGLHLVPLGGATYYLGSSSAIGLAPEPLPSVHAVRGMLNGLVAEFHRAFFHARVAVRGPGFRPVSLDTFPLIGESHLPGVWFCTATRRDGFTCAPFLARELAKELSGQSSELPALFRPCRPLISYRDRRRATDAAVDDVIGSELMNGLSVPPYRWDEWVARHRRRVEFVYDRRQLVEFGIHPEVLHLYESDESYRLTAHPRDRP